MKNFLRLFLLVFGVTVAAVAQQSDERTMLLGVPIIVEKKNAAVTFEATVDGRAAKIERIDAPGTVPLRLAVIDLRGAVGGSRRGRQLPETLPPELRSINLRAIQGSAELIRIGQSQAFENHRSAAGWQFRASANFETAVEEVADFFAAGQKSERQALLIVTDSASRAEGFDINRSDALMTAPGRLVTVVMPESTGEAGRSGGETVRRQIEKWRESLSSFYVIQIAVPALPAAEGLIEAVALSKNKIIGRGSRAVNPSLSLDSGDEVAAALADHSRLKSFETIKKYPGLPEAEFEYLKAHYAPPIEGVVLDADPARGERLKRLGDRVFRLHGVHRQCAVVLLESRVPTVFTWKMTFVSLTVKDLEILNDDEITALIAHEVGHLYFAADLSKARVAGDDRLARVTELKCDLIALETLRRLKIKEDNLVSAIEKLIKARREMNLKSAEAGTPAFNDRRRLAQNYRAMRER